MKKYVEIEKVLLTISVFAGFLFICSMCFEAFQPVVIGDETFSMKMVENNYFEILHLTAMDVHPPLYYWILKIITSLKNVLPVSVVTLGKLTSVLPFLILFIISLTKVRMRFGIESAAVFILCITGMPKMMHYAVEVRMYSWGILFLVCMCLAFYDWMQAEDWKFQNLRFAIWGLLAAYVHYFAALSAAVIYVMMFVWALLYERKKLKGWLVGSIITVTGYLPWIPVLFRQVKSVNSGYWIEELSFRTLLSFFQFIFNPAVYIYYSGTILGFATFLTVTGIALFALMGSKEKRKGFLAFSGIFTCGGVVVIGILAAWLMSPVLSERYLLFGMGVLWLGTAIGISLQKKKKLKIAIILFFLVITYLNLQQFIRVEEESREGWKKTEKILEEIETEDVILTNFGQVRLTLSYYKPETPVCYYWRQRTEELFKNLYGNLYDTRDEDAILEKLSEKNKIYFFDVENVDEFHFKEDCKDPEILFEDMGRVLIEDIYVHVYKVTRVKEA